MGGREAEIRKNRKPLDRAQRLILAGPARDVLIQAKLSLAGCGGLMQAKPRLGFTGRALTSIKMRRCATNSAGTGPELVWRPQSPSRSSGRNGRLRFKLFESRDRVGGIHQRRAAAHVNRHAERLLHFLPSRPQPDQRLGMKADAGIAMGGDAKRQSNQLFGLLVE